MTFPKYPKYKDSGVPWLGEVPASWEVNRVRSICEIKKRIAGALGHDVLSITQQGIRVKNIESNEGQLSMDYAKYQIVQPGDFAMNHMDLLTGFIDIAPVPGVTSPDYRVFALREPSACHDRFLLYVFQMGYRQKIFYAYGQGSSLFGRWRLPTEQFNDFRVPVPPLDEQRVIAAFLDRETGKIDALVAEQERLIELLKEKRQAVISHAVTKGLDPTAPMKPSGIEWLGEVPAHWELKKLKYLLAEHPRNGISPEIDPDGTTPTFSTAAVADGVVNIDPYLKYVSLPPAKAAPFLVKTGDVLLLRGSGSKDLVGRAGIVEREPPDGCVYPDILIRVRPNAGVTPYFLVACLNSGIVRLQMEADAQTAAGIWKISGGSVQELLLACPPRAEQERIWAHLARVSSELSALIAEAERAIALLQERRAALISAAVTGQIDVRAASKRTAA